jgi:hypothetical protein
MNRAVLTLVLTVCLAGCGGGSVGGPAAVSQSSASSPTSATSEKVNFTAFTTAMVATRPDGTSPIAVTSSEFTFPDDDNPGAFSAVLAGL